MKNSYLSRKEEIILSTISMIHKVGIHSLSMKEIAKKEGVTEASLYKHFKSKEALLISVMEYYEKYDDHISMTLRNSSYNVSEGLLKYFVLYAEYYDGYKEITSLIGLYDVLSYNINFADKAKDLAERRTRDLDMLIQRGQRTENISEQMGAEDLAHILLGTFDRIIYMWKLRDYSFSLKEKTEEMIGNLLRIYKTLKN